MTAFLSQPDAEGKLERAQAFLDGSVVPDSLADYWDQTREVVFEVRAQRKWRVALDPEIYAQLKVQARRRGITPETLVNLWLLERLSRQSAETGHKETITASQ